VETFGYTLIYDMTVFTKGKILHKVMHTKFHLYKVHHHNRKWELNTWTK